MVSFAIGLLIRVVLMNMSKDSGVELRGDVKRIKIPVNSDARYIFMVKIVYSFVVLLKRFFNILY